MTVDEENPPIMICSVRDIDDKKEYEKKLEYLSTHDHLTGIFSRMYFGEVLERQYRKEAYPISIIFCDIVGLKAVNDTQGHDAGDRMIKRCADLWGGESLGTGTFWSGWAGMNSPS